MAYERREITLHTRIAIPVKSFKYKVFPDIYMDKYLVTTPGKLLFNEIFPDTFQYINEGSSENIEKITPSKYFLDKGVNIKEEISKMPLTDAFNKGILSKLIAQIYKRYQTTETSVMLDKLKDLGFKYSTLSGISIAISDIKESKIKPEVLKESQDLVDQINKQFKRGLITDQERYEKVIETWTNAKKRIQVELEQMVKEDSDNPISIMMMSKARGDINSHTQLVGMRGLFSKPMVCLKRFQLNLRLVKVLQLVNSSYQLMVLERVRLIQP